MRSAAVWMMALLTGAALACSGSEAEPRPTPTLVPPEISPALVILGEGTLALEIAPGQRQFIEPLKLAEAFGTPPDCARLAALFRWRIFDGAEVRFEGQLRGATIPVEQGNGGAFSVGCMVVEAVNDGSKPIKGDMRYYIAVSR